MSSGSTKRRIEVEGEAALAALFRARQRAERLALMTGTCLIQAVNGKPVRVAPRPEAGRNDKKAGGSVSD
jgi:hypothetical protein